MSERTPKDPEKPASSERNVSDETLKRFKDFIKTRATRPADAQDGEHTTGEFTVDDPSQLIPADTVIYDYYKYGQGSGEQDGIQLHIGSSSGDNIVMLFGLWVTEEGIQRGIGENVTDANDELVNRTLTEIEDGEAEGRITPAPVPAEG